MSYLSKLVQRYGAEPFFLYEITKSGTVHRFAASRSDIIQDDITWSASAATHDKIEHTSNPNKNSFTITFPISDAFASQLLGRQNEYDTTVRVLHGFKGLASTPEDPATVVKFNGVLADVSAKGKRIELTFRSPLSLLERPGNNRIVSHLCPHTLYDADTCKVNRSLFTVSAEVTALSGALLTIPDAAIQADEYYTFGIAQFNGRDIWIKRHVGNLVRLVNVMPDLEVGDFIDISAGCSKTLTTCHDTFANTSNNGSFPQIYINPADGL